jgi:N-dimethylarginine dimethylaminohydrolase
MERNVKNMYDRGHVSRSVVATVHSQCKLHEACDFAGDIIYDSGVFFGGITERSTTNAHSDHQTWFLGEHDASYLVDRDM